MHVKFPTLSLSLTLSFVLLAGCRMSGTRYVMKNHVEPFGTTADGTAVELLAPASPLNGWSPLRFARALRWRRRGPSASHPHASHIQDRRPRG